MLEVHPVGVWALLLVLGVLLALWFYPTQQRKDLPPEVPPCPPGQKSWDYYAAKAKEVGSDVICYRNNGKLTIVLNSAQSVMDLLEKRGAIYSSRPKFVLESIAKGAGWIVVLPYGEKLRATRKLLHAALMEQAADRYKPIQTLESAVFLKEMLDKPGNWRVLVRDAACRVACQVSFGFRPADLKTDPLFVAHFASVKERMDANRQYRASFIERFPILAYLPSFMSPALKAARKAGIARKALWLPHYERVEQQVKEGGAPWSFARDIISRDPAELELPRFDAAMASTVPFAVGIDTITMYMQNFMFCCCVWGPTFLPKMVAELESVVGSDRLPTFDDLPSLPYLVAVTEEVHRRGSAVPHPSPHALDQDDVYRGMFLPKGSTIQSNYLPCHQEEAIYPDWQAFKPERFLNGNMPAVGNRWGHFGWGAGRRACPGRHLARNAYRVLIARLVWAFEIEASEHVDASEKTYANAGMLRLPDKIPVSFEVRSAAHRQIIENEWQAIQPELRVAEQQ